MARQMLQRAIQKRDVQEHFCIFSLHPSLPRADRLPAEPATALPNRQ